MENDETTESSAAAGKGRIEAEREDVAALSEQMKELARLLDDEKKRSEDYLIRLKYLQADFENYRKRVDREIRELEEFSTAGLVKKLIPVLDDLERAVETASKGGDKGMLEGVSMVQKNLSSVLTSEGLEPVDPVGKPFDPALQESVDVVKPGPGDKRGPGTVVEEVRKGYTFKGRVLRPSAVKVLAPSKAEEHPVDTPEEREQ